MYNNAQTAIATQLTFDELEYIKYLCWVNFSLLLLWKLYLVSSELVADGSYYTPMTLS